MYLEFPATVSLGAEERNLGNFTNQTENITQFMQRIICTCLCLL